MMTGSNTTEPAWVWETTDPRRSGSSGDIAKLFKNEGVKQPGPFGSGAPSTAATLMAREVVQNSSDAAAELAAELGDGAPDFEISFDFRDLVGDEKASLVSALDLATLATHLETIDGEPGTSRTRVGLGTSNALDHLHDDTPLKILQIRETGTTGMYGPFVQAKSKLFLALISVGYTVKQAGAGGSYGYGKAGLIAASATRTVVAYTCFRERDDDPGVTRRLLGMTYWGQHDIGVDSFTGFARYGRVEDAWAIPFENEQADEIAQRLGLELRDPRRVEDLGTTFLVVDVEVEPSDLEIALARNWWPAIIDRSFHPTVRHLDVAGVTTKFDVRPRKDPLLQSFVRAWELATTQQDNNVPTELRKDLGKTSAATGSLPMGFLGAHADLSGWSYAQSPAAESEDEDEGVINAANMSLVALVRGPRMIVEYLPLMPGRQPFVRGVFCADAAIDDLLRQTEPKAHDAWQRNMAEEGIDSRAPKVAGGVLTAIKKTITEFQNRLKPPPPDPADVRLPVFQELFRKLLSGQGSGPKPPPAGVRDVSIKLNQRIVVADNGSDVALVGHAELVLSPHYVGDTAIVDARLTYKFLEDGISGEECSLSVSLPPGFSKNPDGAFRGELGRVPLHLEFRSDTYSPDWTGRLVVSCVVVKTTPPEPAPGQANNDASRETEGTTGS